MLRGRVGARKDGFTHTACALAWNKLAMSRPLLPWEFRLDTSARKPAEVVRLAMRHLHSLERGGSSMRAMGRRPLPPSAMFVDVRDWFQGPKPIIPREFRQASI